MLTPTQRSLAARMEKQLLFGAFQPNLQIKDGVAFALIHRDAHIAWLCNEAILTAAQKHYRNASLTTHRMRINDQETLCDAIKFQPPALELFTSDFISFYKSHRNGNSR